MAKQGSSEIYTQVRKDHPDFIEALDALGRAARKAGPLDEKTVQLVQLGAAAAIGATASVASHARRALDAGAKRAELRHAVMATVNISGFPNVIGALAALEQVPRKAGK
ncbi:MAG: hypothetical protein AUK49_01830 [Betaproteobacteria bacterium CG2_30_68_42]|nr:MAG: hypothetical protein AUK49_01830 [Betaproteobacteria bacterium CG2_30_68_42]PIX75153.1 MAG: alkylhydroperoxidase [Rhodocyclales bacterium CG_4_10_14_3_um_filter_68_10]PJA58224.1 MAG: alkylhydroperoxidase [Rhodocyclales bacterium CG_4_9_14_3_um_filter_68_10]